MAESEPRRNLAPYRKRLAELKREAEPYMPLWRQLNEYIMPWSGRFLFSDRDLPEIRRGQNSHNSTVFNAIQTAASGLHGGLTSPSRPWFELVHPDRELMESGPVKSWIYDLEQNERAILAQSNFYAKIQALYYEALCYGRGVMLIEADPRTAVRFRTLTCGEYWLANGADLRVNTVYRRFTMTAAQLREMFPEQNLSGRVKDALSRGSLDEIFPVVHAVQPWGTFDSHVHPDWTFESVYFEEDAPSDGVMLARRGYRTQPFVAVRWGAIGDDVYGYGPGHMSLADVRQLQTMERAYVNAVNWAADPAWLVSDAMKDSMARGDIRPGAVIAANATEAQNLFKPLLPNVFDFHNIRVKIQDVEERIRNAFYNTLFLMVASRQREMTATEVQQLVEEKASVLGPVLETFQSEIFDPVLERVYDIMDNEFSLIPPPPEDLEGENLKIEYVSLLAQAQKQAGLSNLNHFLAVTGQVLQAFPETADKINADEIIDTMTTISPINPSIVRSDDEVAEMRAARQEAAQQQQMLASMPELAGAARDLGAAPVSADNALGQMLGMGEGQA